MSLPKRYDNEVILAFGDTHFPYHDHRVFDFLNHVDSVYKPDRVIHMGDVLDIYSVSDYPKDADHPHTWKDEIQKARECVKTLAQIFPDLEVMSSNHDDRVYKKSRVSGIPREFMIKYEDVLGAPPTWKWYPHLTLTVDSSRRQIFFAHTKTGGALRTAQDIGKTCVLGHNHCRFGAEAFKPTNKKIIWGVDAGCLVSDKGAPYSYNKNDRGRPIKGCVVLVGGVPNLIPLER
jgi:hypothetical protein